MADNTRGQRPARQSAGARRNGIGEGGDPTIQRGQLPGEIFGIPQHYSTGAPGTSSGSVPADVTQQKGQPGDAVYGVTEHDITSTGAPGSEGARRSGGGEAVAYTDPFAFLGGGGAGQASTRGQLSGDGDWTQANGDGYAGGPTLPVLQNARPTSTGAGQGRVSTHRKG